MEGVGDGISAGVARWDWLHRIQREARISVFFLRIKSEEGFIHKDGCLGSAHSYRKWSSRRSRKLFLSNRMWTGQWWGGEPKLCPGILLGPHGHPPAPLNLSFLSCKMGTLLHPCCRGDLSGCSAVMCVHTSSTWKEVSAAPMCVACASLCFSSCCS